MTMILCDRNITVNDESSSSWYGTPTYFMHNVHTFETCKMYSARPPHWQVPEVERITYRVNCARRYNDNRARDWTRKRIAKTGKKPYSRRTCNITISENERFFVQYIRPIVKEVVTSDDIGIITRVYYNMHKICRGSLRLCCIRAQRFRRKRYNISLLLPYDRMCTCVRMKPHCKRVFYAKNVKSRDRNISAKRLKLDIYQHVTELKVQENRTLEHYMQLGVDRDCCQTISIGWEQGMGLKVMLLNFKA